jgi:colicin import membrane protein
MSRAALDPLRPRRPGGMGRGAVFAAGVHVLLLVALALGVSWRSSEPQGVTAELWAAVPETAAPAAQPVQAPVTPPAVEAPKPLPPKPAEPERPQEPPREADIAAEQEKEKQKLKEQEKERERVRAEAEKKRREQEEAQKLKEAERVEAQRQAQLNRMLGQAGATGSPTATGTGARDAGPKGPSDGYGDRIRAGVKPNIVLTESIEGSPRAEVEVRAAPDGSIINRRLVKPSGNPAWDDAVLRAIDRTAVLPRDLDGTVPSPIRIVFAPN